MQLLKSWIWVWELITRSRCQSKTVKGPMCHFYGSYESSHWSRLLIGPLPRSPCNILSLWKGHSNARLTFMASSACLKLLLSVASWVCFTSSCQEESGIWDGWVFTGRVSVSYYHQRMMNTAESQMYRSETVPEDICHSPTLS